LLHVFGSLSEIIGSDSHIHLMERLHKAIDLFLQAL